MRFPDTQMCWKGPSLYKNMRLHSAWLLGSCCLMFCICIMVSWFLHACSWLALIYLIMACSDKLNHGLFCPALGLFRECKSVVVILFTAPSCLFSYISSSHSSLLFSSDHTPKLHFCRPLYASHWGHQSNYWV